MPEVTFTGDNARAGIDTPIPYVHFRLVQTSGGDLVYQWSFNSLSDDTVGWIDGRLLDLTAPNRALSDHMGLHEVQTFTWTISDADGLVATLLENATAKYLLNRLATVYVHEDRQRRASASNTGRVLARGVLRSYDKRPGRKVDFVAEDWLTSSFGPFNTFTKIPKRTISYSIFGDAPYYVFGSPEPIIYGSISDEGASPTGLVPCIPVGTEDISGTTWKRFLIAGHACKTVYNLYQNGAVCSYGTDVIAPGKTGWPFGTTYRDIGGRRYTLIYAKGTPGDTAFAGTAPIFANVQGIEDVGDGSGTLITDLLMQYRHFLCNWALQDYQTGGWLAAPNWPNSNPTVACYDATSFATASTVMGTRVGGGYVGGGIINEQAELREWIARWNNSCDVNSGFDRTGQFFVIADATLAATASFDDVNDIIDDSFEAPLIWDRHATTIPYSYCRDYLGKKWIYENVEVYSQTAIDNHKFERRMQLVELWFVRTAAISENIAANRLRRYMDPPRRVKFETALHATNLELGNWIHVSSREGTGSSGWTDRHVRVDRMQPDPLRCKVLVEGVDMDAQTASPTYAVRAGTQSQVGGYIPPSANGLPPSSSGSGITVFPLGGDRTVSIDSPGPTATQVPNAIPVNINGGLYQGKTATVTVWARSEGAGNVTVDLYDATAGASAGSAAPVVGNTWAMREFTVSLANALHVYYLRVLPSVANEQVYAQGYLTIA